MDQSDKYNCVPKNCLEVTECAAEISSTELSSILQDNILGFYYSYFTLPWTYFTSPSGAPEPQEQLNALNIWQLEREVGILQTEFLLRMIGTVNTFILEGSCKSHPQAFPLLGCAKEEEEQHEKKCRAEERA